MQVQVQVRLSDLGQLEPAVGGVRPDLVAMQSVLETRERAISRRQPARDLRRGPVGGPNVRTSERQNVVRRPAITLRPPCGAKPRTTDVA